MKFRLTAYAFDQITKKQAAGGSTVLSMPRTRSMDALRVNLGPVLKDQESAASQEVMRQLYDRNPKTAWVEPVEEKKTASTGTTASTAGSTNKK